MHKITRILYGMETHPPFGRQPRCICQLYRPSLRPLRPVAALISDYWSTSLLLFLDEDLGVLHEEVHVELVFRFLILVRANVKEHFILINRILIFVDWVQ